MRRGHFFFISCTNQLQDNGPDDLFRQPGGDPELPSLSTQLHLGRGGGSDGMSHRRDFFGEALRHSEKNFGGRLDLNLSCCLQVVTLAGDSSSKPPFFSMQNGVNSCSLKLSGTQLSNKQDPL